MQYITCMIVVWLPLQNGTIERQQTERQKRQGSVQSERQRLHEIAPVGQNGPKWHAMQHSRDASMIQMFRQVINKNNLSTHSIQHAHKQDSSTWQVWPKNVIGFCMQWKLLYPPVNPLISNRNFEGQPSKAKMIDLKWKMKKIFFRSLPGRWGTANVCVEENYEQATTPVPSMHLTPTRTRARNFKYFRKKEAFWKRTCFI